MNFNFIESQEKMDEFLIQKRPFLKCRSGHLHFGNFPDDLFDQSIMGFFEDVSYIQSINQQVEEEGLEVLKEDIEEILVDRYGAISIKELQELFSEDFWIKVRRWVTMFLGDFYFTINEIDYKEVSSEVLDVIINGSSQYLVATAEPGEIWAVEDVIQHFDSVFSWTDKASLHLLYTVFAKNLSCASYVSDRHYHNFLYWLYPNSHSFFVDDIDDDCDDEDDYENPLDKLFLKIIPEILKSRPIPDNIFSDALLSKIKQFIREFILNDLPSHEKTPKMEEFVGLSVEWEKIINDLFLNFAYHGFVDGRIPGIKQGAYSTKKLEDELDELASFNLSVKNKMI